MRALGWFIRSGIVAVLPLQSTCVPAETATLTAHLPTHSVLDALAQTPDVERRAQIIRETDFDRENLPVLPPSCPRDLWLIARSATETLHSYLRYCDGSGTARPQQTATLLKFLDLREANLRQGGYGNLLIAFSMTFAVDVFLVRSMVNGTMSPRDVRLIKGRNALSALDLLARIRTSLPENQGDHLFDPPDPNLSPEEAWCRVYRHYGVTCRVGDELTFSGVPPELVPGTLRFLDMSESRRPVELLYALAHFLDNQRDVERYVVLYENGVSLLSDRRALKEALAPLVSGVRLQLLIRDDVLLCLELLRDIKGRSNGAVIDPYEVLLQPRRGQ